MTRRSAVLDAPEQRYASGTGGPRRMTGSLRRSAQGGFGQDFDEFDRFDSDGLASEGDDAGPRTRVNRRLEVRGGVVARLMGRLPQTVWGRIAAGLVLVAGLGICTAGVLTVRSALLRDERFVIPSSEAIAIEGNRHVTKAQLLSIFGGDVERNIFTVSLSERKAELERLPWVERATVMRLLPDHLRVSIVERTPVAFVRQGNHIGLVDKSGVLMDMAPGASEGGTQYSFPVVAGITADEPLSTRAARMKIYERFTHELDADGGKISQSLSEVDLSNPEDVRALIPDDRGEVLVHLGDTDFLGRYGKYKDHLAEWRTQYPKLTSVDMRYDRQVVLEMQPGTAVPVSGTEMAAPADVLPGRKTATPKVPVVPVHHPAVTRSVVAPLHPSGPLHVAAAAGPSSGIVDAPLVNVPVTQLKGSTAPAIVPVPKPAVSAPPLLTGTAPAAPHHLTVATSVPIIKSVPATKIAVKHLASKKSLAKRVVAKKTTKKAAGAKVHPSVAQR